MDASSCSGATIPWGAVALGVSLGLSVLLLIILLVWWAGR